MKFILGKKLGMSQIFAEDGTVIPVTAIEAGPCKVAQIRTLKKRRIYCGSNWIWRKKEVEQAT